MRRRVLVGAAAAGAAAALAAGAVWAATSTAPDGTALLVGYFRPTQQIALSNLTVVEGTYLVEYGAEVQFFSRDHGTVLHCGLVDASGRIGYLDDTTFPVPPDGTWTRIGDSATYDVPEITLGIRCSSTAAGSFGIGYRGVRLTAEPIG